MTKLLEYLLPGIALAAIFFALDLTIISQQIRTNAFVDVLLTVLPLLCIIVPCIIYFIKMPPGKDTRP
ncbi:MAG: hypothetical protein MJY85_02105 [Fibrobacter sp.]|nr:hypothetical protein [Fibrobacter sp.]